MIGTREVGYELKREPGIEETKLNEFTKNDATELFKGIYAVSNYLSNMVSIKYNNKTHIFNIDSIEYTEEYLKDLQSRLTISSDILKKMLELTTISYWGVR